MIKKTRISTQVKPTEVTSKKIDRKEAIKKTGYIAAATMLILLSSNKAQANGSPAPPSDWPFDDN